MELILCQTRRHTCVDVVPTKGKSDTRQNTGKHFVKIWKWNFILELSLDGQKHISSYLFCHQEFQEKYNLLAYLGESPQDGFLRHKLDYIHKINISISMVFLEVWIRAKNEEMLKLWTGYHLHAYEMEFAYQHVTNSRLPLNLNLR